MNKKKRVRLGLIGCGNEIFIGGNKGYLHYSYHRFDSLQFFPIKGFSGSLSYRIRSMANILKALPIAVATFLRGGNSMGAYRSEWRHFADCIIRDKPVECTLEDGKRALQLALACTESSSTRQPVKVARAGRDIVPLEKNSR